LRLVEGCQKLKPLAPGFPVIDAIGIQKVCQPIHEVVGMRIAEKGRFIGTCPFD
jgi:hypothetical protein